jgi:hypothetical protein
MAGKWIRDTTGEEQDDSGKDESMCMLQKKAFSVMCGVNPKYIHMHHNASEDATEDRAYDDVPEYETNFKEDLTESPPTNPLGSCYVKLDKCDRDATIGVWLRDEYGEKHDNTGIDADKCTVDRRRQIAAYCKVDIDSVHMHHNSKMALDLKDESIMVAQPYRLCAPDSGDGSVCDSSNSKNSYAFMPIIYGKKNEYNIVDVNSNKTCRVTEDQKFVCDLADSSMLNAATFKAVAQDNKIQLSQNGNNCRIKDSNIICDSSDPFFFTIEESNLHPIGADVISS